MRNALIKKIISAAITIPAIKYAISIFSPLYHLFSIYLKLQAVWSPPGGQRKSGRRHAGGNDYLEPIAITSLGVTDTTLPRTCAGEMQFSVCKTYGLLSPFVVKYISPLDSVIATTR